MNRAGNRHRGEHGFMTVQYVAATGLTLLFLMMLANVLVNLYARGVVREALDEGARAAAPIDAPAPVCEARAREVLDDLLRGPMGDGITVTCDVAADRSRAHADVTLRSWLPALVPAWHFTVDASARRET